MNVNSLPPKKVAIVANGAIHDYEKMGALVKTFPYVVAADGGVHNCHEMGILPDLIVGDFDSTSSELLREYAHVPQKKFSANKDKTDLELALEEVLFPETEKIVIFGALEKRLDHSLYNAHLLQRSPGKIFIESEWETLYVIHEEAEVSCSPGQVISLIPLGGAVTGVTTKGLKWELKEASFDKNFMSLSNICLSDSFHVAVQEGDILCCLCK